MSAWQNKRAQQQVRDAISLIGEARRSLTILEFERFVRDNTMELGGHGFLCSIGQAILDGATVDVTNNEPH